MGRVKCVLVAGAVTLAVSALAACPAVAAKGGNNGNAHACQQGGGAGLLDENEFAFKNAGGLRQPGSQRQRLHRAVNRHERLRLW